MSELVAKPIGANIPPEISDRLERLELLYTLSLDIFGARNIDELLTVVMSRVTKAMKADRSTLFIVDQERRVIWSKVAQGTEPFTVPMGRGISGYVAQTGETLNIPDAYQDERFNPEVDRRTGYKTNSILCMPVKDREGVVIAVIQAINKLDGIFSEQDEDFLRALSAQIQLAIENSTLYQDLKSLFESMMEAMASTIDARHPTTAGHTMRVRAYSLAIAAEMGYSEEDLEILNYAALLHDYGKIGVRESILTKPGRLTDEEYSEMKQHVVYTMDILNKIRFAPRFREIPDIAGHHHERVDGRGYPDGLTGDQMHPLSKVMAVADVFDALTSVRDYRSPLDPNEVLEMMKKDIGTHFDEDCMLALERYFMRTNLGDQIRERNRIEIEARLKNDPNAPKLIETF
ncbi:MAG: GAF domain-containing protein [Candidatus Omnitrophica bacterium]|nr:GAF domain-containing protein [Candidatus Omnitrophota bacterium]